MKHAAPGHFILRYSHNDFDENAISIEDKLEELVCPEGRILLPVAYLAFNV